MIGIDESIRAMLRLLCETSRARTATLYVPMSSSSKARPVLIHEGQPPYLPELADLKSAVEFERRAGGEERDSPALSNWIEPRSLPSADEQGRLVRIPALDSLIFTETVPSVERRREDRRHLGPASPGDSLSAGAWLGLRFDRLPGNTERVAGDQAVLLGVPKQSWATLLALSSALGCFARRESVALDDPVSALPQRDQFQKTLERLLRADAAGRRPGLIFVNPDGFGVVNERYGREAGDTAIGEIGRRLRGHVKRGDFVFRFGAAVFCVLVKSATEESIRRISDRLHGVLCREAYLEGSLRLEFRLGAAIDVPDAGASVLDRAAELTRRADRALHAAKLSNGGRFFVWSPEVESTVASQYDRLSGIYTSNPTKDYRNMLLLWDTVGIVGAHDDVESLVIRVLERLAETFSAATLGLYGQGEDGRPGAGMLRRPEGAGAVKPVEAPSLDAARIELFEQASKMRRAVTRPVPVGAVTAVDDSPMRACAIPLGTEDRPLGFLYLEWNVDGEQVGPADLRFLDALAGQLTMAMNHARLIENERREQETRTDRLQAELDRLRGALQHSQLVCRSVSMQAVLATAGRVAPTDVTVLINGESGTGKELLARTIHRLSERKDKPLVVVDCGAITTSLIDSELFGHERGAYTGAEQRTTGRLAEADGGTILLDEIGELPLEVQSKILRFVQEKQYTRVGGTKPETVDVRVIAITHRDLPREVAAGRFREDLFHRLNVVRLVVPPLRDRPDDVLPLARDFLERFALEHRKRVRRLSPAAEKLLLEQSWEGNVRELQNRVMRAVVLSDGEQIEAGALAVSGNELPATDRETGSDEKREAAATDKVTAEDAYRAALRAVRDALARQIETALVGSDYPPPVGKWAGDDLVLEAYRATERTASRAASLLAVPETSFRRRLQKVLALSGSGVVPRPEGWEPMRAEIARLVDFGNPSGEDLLERLRDTLLEELASRLPDDNRRASALLGVTEPTYRRWIAERAPATPKRA